MHLILQHLSRLLLVIKAALAFLLLFVSDSVESFSQGLYLNSCKGKGIIREKHQAIMTIWHWEGVRIRIRDGTGERNGTQSPGQSGIESRPARNETVALPPSPSG